MNMQVITEEEYAMDAGERFRVRRFSSGATQEQARGGGRDHEPVSPGTETHAAEGNDAAVLRRIKTKRVACGDVPAYC